MRALMGDRNARFYLGGQFFSLFGDTALWLAMGIWVKELTHSNAEAGLTFFFFAVPSLASPLAGLVVDRIRRRPVLFAANLGGAAVVLPLLLVHGRGQVWIIWLVMVGYGIVYDFLGSAQSAYLVTMLPDELLGDANAALSTTREGLRLIAPLAGAGLLTLVGGGAVAIIDAGTFLVAALSLCAVRVHEPKPGRSAQHFVAEVLAGVRHVSRIVVLRQAVIAAGVSCLVVGFLETLMFAVVSEGLHRPPTFLGVLLSLQGAGAIGGGLTASSLIRRYGEGLVVGGGLVVLGAGTALLMIASLAPVVAGTLLLGASLPWLIVALITLTQRRTPPELQGRVSSAVDLIVATPQTISIAVGAAIVGLAPYALLVAIVAGVLAASGAWLLTRREQWEDRGGSGTAEPVASGAADPATVEAPGSEPARLESA